ncbi:LPS O-antigen chain length determinant protein WzzB [Aeromonas caviae]
MTNKEITTKMDAQLPQGWQAASGVEIDLRELIMVLWRQKALILLVTVLFAVAGVAYALLAPQQWSAKAVIAEPKQEDVLVLQNAAARAALVGLKRVPTEEQAYKAFVIEFNAYENRRDFLKKSEQFTQAINEQQLDDKKQRRWLRDWAKLAAATPVDKKGELPGVELSFAADTATGSLAQLRSYIDYIVELQRQELKRQLELEKNTLIETLELQKRLIGEDARRVLKQEMDQTKLSLQIAKAAAVAHPLENYSAEARFPIALGEKGLEEKLKLLGTMDLAVFEPKLGELQQQISRLKDLDLEMTNFTPFSYLDAPDEPLSRDKPKRPLIVVLATLLGGMLGVGIVLVRHAFRRPEQA